MILILLCELVVETAPLAEEVVDLALRGLEKLPRCADSFSSFFRCPKYSFPFSFFSSAEWTRPVTRSLRNQPGRVRGQTERLLPFSLLFPF